jgi:hypothetical protein
MTFLDFCSLCGASVGPKYARSAQDEWKGQTQELCVDSTGALMIPRRPRFPVLHRSCWIVVKKVAPLEPYDAFWLKDFRDCLRNISPLLRHSQPEAAPELLAEELETILTSPKDAPTVPLPRLLPLPVELLHDVYSFLTEFSDVDNLRTATGRDPPVAIWMSLWRKYDDWQLKSGKDEQFSATVEHILRKLEHPSAENLLWPHAASFITVWKNCELVLKLYSQRQYGLILDHDEHHLSWLHSSDSKCHNQTLRTQKFEARASSTLTMNFVDIYDRRYLCGIKINKDMVGYKGDYSVTSEVETWTGLRLISDGLGFVSFQIRDLLGWQDADSMYQHHALGPESRYCEVRWDRDSLRGILVLSYDVSSCFLMFCSAKAN